MSYKVLNTYSHASDQLSFMDVVTDALEATGRSMTNDDASPCHPIYNRNTILDIYLEETDQGWIGNVGFKVPEGVPDVIGCRPVTSYQQALESAASVACYIISGSPELPFFFHEGRITVVAYQ
ncbi:hypothetical protein [Pseudooceanicola sp. MF1-13]|uniref:hypothetical protein n=1 Tax=Pseudooceanicola sp. MF1-13 TaxID=3379095 RepID=UPI003892C707